MMQSLVLVGLLAMNTILVSLNIDDFRKAYPLAVENANTCEQEIKRIKDIKPTKPLEQAYIGALYAVWAGHLTSPLEKLNAFKKGKNMLEEAIKTGNQDAEIHFLRLTIQQNAPAILGYNDNKKQDIEIVIKKFDTLNSPLLKNNIKQFFSQNNLLSAQQKKVLE
ncbi:hypothetical protein [Sphingobacterium sp. LRF_L2]|uniref:hypothetical protein n=1 Tax=Sphingobacterium sp. LRF_L2 TaxID=3369421 RepID=UPI003F62D949